MDEQKPNSALICVPGQRLCLADENTVAGQGTYERQGYVYSLLAGIVEITEKEKVRMEGGQAWHHLTSISLMF